VWRVADLINGIDSAVIVYGQTGSGKTYTLFGDNSSGEFTGVHSGLVPRCCDLLLAAVVEREKALGIQSAITMSYVEIYGNDITDLLRGGTRLGQSRVAANRYVLDGAADVQIPTSLEGGRQAMQRLLAMGEEMKRRASTSMNERSSRAHAIMTLTLVQTDPATGYNVRNR